MNQDRAKLHPLYPWPVGSRLYSQKKNTESGCDKTFAKPNSPFLQITVLLGLNSSNTVQSGFWKSVKHPLLIF